MYDSVQLRGKEPVLKAYTARGVDFWAIFCKKDLIVKGQGEQDLEQFLDMLESNESGAQYKLKVYEDVTDLKQIKEKTEADGSITFVLKERTDTGNHREYYRTKELSERIGTIEELLLADKEEEEKPQTLTGFLNGIIKSPQDIVTLLNAGRTLLGMSPMPNIPPQINSQFSNSIGGIDHTQPMQTTDEENQRIAAALDKLAVNDPKLVEHLEKLANMPPQKLQILLSMLDTMQ